MAAMFLAMVWHARRRVDALQIAEQRAEQSRSLLERQERFIHDASHELRTPVTIARGHLELLRGDGARRRGARRRARRAGADRRDHRAPAGARHRRPARLPAPRARSSSSRSSRTCSCAGRRSLRGPGAWARWPRAGFASTPTGCAPPSTRCSRTRSSTRAGARAIELRAPLRRRGAAADRGRGRGLRRARRGAAPDLRPLRARRRGADAHRRRRRARAGDRRRDRQGARRPLHGREHRTRLDLRAPPTLLRGGGRVWRPNPPAKASARRPG